MNEIWKPVLGWKRFYEISNLGRVRSLGRYKNGKSGSINYHKGKILKSSYNKGGYLKISFYNGNRFKTIPIHRLVAISFVPNHNNKPCVNHIDNIKLNNKSTNLEWCTHKENMEHMRIQNRSCVGEKNGRAKLTVEDVFNIKKMRNDGISYKIICSKYSISYVNFYDIIKGKRWNHL